MGAGVLIVPFFDWSPAIGTDTVMAALTTEAGGTIARLAIQTAAVRTDVPDDWAIVTADSGLTVAGEGRDCSAALGVSGRTAGKAWVRWGVAFYMDSEQGTTAPGAADGTLELGDVALGTYAVADGTWHGIAHGDSRVCGIRSDRGESVACVDIIDATEVTISGLPAGPILDVCVAEDEGCALDLSGAPACWSEAPPLGSIQGPPPGPFVQITCGFDHACALTAEGTIECWGTDYAGETVVPS